MDDAVPPSFAKHVKTVWQYLIEPSTAVCDLEQQRKSRLLAAVLLALLVLLPMVTLLRILMHLVNRVELNAILVTCLLLFIAYLLSRRGYYQAVSALLTVCGSLLIFALAAATNAGLDSLVLNYLVAPILFGGLFLSIRTMIVIFLAQLTGIWLLTYLVPGLAFRDVLDGPMTFNLMAGTIALLTTYYRNVLGNSRRAQLLESEANQARQKQILELIATGKPLIEILTELIQMTETQVPGMMGSALLLDPDGIHVRHYAAPKLPEAYVQAIDGAAIGPNEGSCGAAAYRNQLIVVEDIATDPLWANYRELATRHHLGACWSQPIRAFDGSVLGTFAMYYREKHRPNLTDIKLIEDAAYLAGIAIQRQRAEEALRKSEAGEREQRLLAEALRDTTAAINSTLKLDDVLDLILIALERVVPHDAADVMLFERGMARIVRARGYRQRGFESEPIAMTFRIDELAYLDRAAETQQVQIVSDAQSDPNWVTTTVSGWIRAYLGAPIMVDGQVIGVVNLNSQIPGKFTDHEANALRAFTDQVSIAIRNAQLYDAIQRDVTELETLRQLALDLTVQLDLNAAMNALTQSMLSLVGAENGALYRYLPDEDALELVIALGAPMSPIGTRFKRGEGFIGRVLETGTTLLIDDYDTWEGRIPAGLPYHFGAMIGIPIRWQGQLLGIFRATSNDSKRPFSKHDAQLLDLLAGQAAVAIRNAQMFSNERQQHELTEALRNTASAVASTLNLDDVLARIVENVGRVVPHDWADISLVEGNVTHIAYCRGWSPEEETLLKSLRLPLSASNFQQMLSENGPLLISNTDTYPGWVQISPEIHSFLGMAIRAHGVLVGFLKLSSARPGFFTVEHAERLRIFADQTAIAIHNAQLYAELRRHTDELEQRIVERTAELYRTKQHTEAILNNSSDAILVIRGDGTISQVNPAFTSLSGYHSDEIVGRPWSTFIKPDPVVEQAFASIFGANQPARIEVEVRRKNGPTFSADAGISAISQDLDGTTPSIPGQMVCSLRDISARKQAEAELRRAFEKEKELGELKDRFIAMVSHEFRTPLTVIRMSSEMLANYAIQLGEDRKLKFLNDIQRQVQYMVELMNDMLTIGKAQADKKPFNPVPLDVKAYATAVLEQIQLTDAGQHQFTFTVSGDLNNVSLDEQLLRQILVNLLSNAIKYSSVGSKVCFGVYREAGDVIFQVQDQGIGIPQADQTHLFEPFHRAQNALKIQGTGLGLSVVKANVELHGGVITFDSQEDVGTTFTVRLPVTSQNQPDVNFSTRLFHAKENPHH